MAVTCEVYTLPTDTQLDVDREFRFIYLDRDVIRVKRLNDVTWELTHTEQEVG